MTKAYASVWRSLAIRTRKVWRRDSTTSPYLSGDAVRSLCDYEFVGGELCRLRPHVDQERDHVIIFCESHRLDDAMDVLHSIDAAFVLVCGNSDHNFNFAPTLPQNCRMAALQNYTGPAKPTIRRLPIGIENASYGRYRFRKVLTAPPSARKMRVFFPPMAATNPVREPYRNVARARPDVFDVFDTYMSERRYFATAKSYWFTASLPGNGIEDHRIWETFYLGGFPVVIKTTWSGIFDELALPALIVPSYEALSPQALTDHAEKWKTFSPEEASPLWLPYWKSLLQNGT